jgi:hypothetical protein
MLGTVLALSLLVAGCGDEGTQSSNTSPPSASTSWSRCADSGELDLVTLKADLDGDAGDERVGYLDATACPAGPLLYADVGGMPLSVSVPGDLPVRDGDLQSIRVPGRTGDVVLVQQRHPRGGFQARLFGYADGELEELTVDGKPIFPFVATDAMTTPLSASCTNGGFEVTEAKAHQPIGVVPAWDVVRTAYAVDRNTVTKSATTEVADNVLDEQLHTKYSDLIDYSLFENCLADR